MGRNRKQKPEPVQRVRSAIYTRKSTEEGLDQDFNSLDAQREAAENYIASQKNEGWVALPDRYDDGGFSGGTIDRPALQRLLRDVECGCVDCIVVYKVDRLSRSLLDFLKIVETLERRGVSFVSVTQNFNSTTSMGRLTLNILLSFAQFEREVIGERIRDKIAAHKRRGKHTGGMPIFGYDVDREAKRLVVNAKEARLVRRIFKRFCELGSTTELAAELNRQGHRTKEWTTVKGKVQGGHRWNKSHLYRLLNNRKYLGEVEHKGEIYDGEHDAIVPRQLWDKAHEILAGNSKVRGNRTRSETPALLKGIIRCAHCDCSMGPTFTRKNGKTYRYYLCVHASKNGYVSCPVRTVAAGEIEDAVVGQLRAVFRTPELVARTFREAKSRESEELNRLREEQSQQEERLQRLGDTAARLLDANGDAGSSIAEELRCTGHDIEEAKRQLLATQDQIRALETHALTEREVIDALERLDPVWEELFPAEQARSVGLLVERVEVRADGIELRLRTDGLRSLVAELMPEPEPEKGAKAG